MSRTTPGGGTERDHLLAHQQQTGRTPPELLVPPVPPGCQLLWTTFMQLHASRGSNGMGPCAISFTELVHWQQLTGVELNPWEIEVLQALDRVAMTAAADQQKRPTPS